MKRLIVPILVMLALSLGGCSSKKSQPVMEDDGTAQTDDSSYPEDGVSSETLVLNGDSDTGKAGALRTVYFAYNRSTLTDSAKQVLSANAEFLKSTDAVEVQIEGHCDERGGIQYNLALGERRAKSVKQYLSSLGVNTSRMSIVSYGKERPIEFSHDETSWSKNRRANFVITAK